MDHEFNRLIRPSVNCAFVPNGEFRQPMADEFFLHNYPVEKALRSNKQITVDSLDVVQCSQGMSVRGDRVIMVLRNSNPPIPGY